MTADGQPLVIARRGASAEAPENTIAAFELALAQGADGILLEVHLSQDNHPVVINDFTLEHTTDGNGPVRQLTVRELKRLDAGGWRGRRFRGQRIQTLQEVFERFRERARFWIELRGGADLYPGIEECVVSTVEIYEVLDRALLQSVDLATLMGIRSLNPELRVAQIVRDQAGHIGLDGIHAVCFDVHRAQESLVAETLAAGLDCYVAGTVDEPAEMEQLVRKGVTGIITDRPDRLRKWLGR
jgi:glycerophosphoryl diester phosphodiesterase